VSSGAAAVNYRRRLPQLTRTPPHGAVSENGSVVLWSLSRRCIGSVSPRAREAPDVGVNLGQHACAEPVGWHSRAGGRACDGREHVGAV
jgi:hypothetical protein